MRFVSNLKCLFKVEIDEGNITHDKNETTKEAMTLLNVKSIGKLKSFLIHKFERNLSENLAKFCKFPN